jgi:TonB family protein
MKFNVLVAAGLLLVGAVPAAAQFDDVPKATSVEGLAMPTVVSESRPSYTPEALRQRVNGSIKLECVVNTDGTVGEVRLLQALEPSLDANAQETLKKWTFKPATKDGKPMAVRVEVEMTFTTRTDGPKLGSTEVYVPGQAGVRLPTVLAEVKPQYPEAAKAAGIQGIVELETVVLPDGKVGDTRVIKHLDPDLDREAMRALFQWRFKPGTKDDKPVPVQVHVEINFSLK